MGTKEYFVYIMAGQSGTLYTGVTNDLQRRVVEHKLGQTPGFTSKYRVNRLVWFDDFSEIHEAIDCEKRIKGWSRQKKINLIESMNPGWKDLAVGWEGTPET